MDVYYRVRDMNMASGMVGEDFPRFHPPIHISEPPDRVPVKRIRNCIMEELDFVRLGKTYTGFELNSAQNELHKYRQEYE
jgi:hypothetical protein